MRPRSDAFSYIELLVSTAIIGVAYTMVLGPNSELGQTRSKARCAHQLAQLHQSLVLYAAEHDAAFPATEGATTSEAPLSLLVPLYTTDTSLFICPGSKDAALPGAEPFAGRRISYAYYMGQKSNAAPDMPLISDAQANTGAKQAGDEVFSASGDAPGNKHRRYGGNVLCVDGRVETLAAKSPRAIPLPPGAALLNPKP
jgi:type II secretory pathway pseudopilin PulG